MFKDERGISFVAVIVIIIVLLIFSLITINVAVNQNEKNNNINSTYLQNNTEEIEDNKTQEDVGNAWIEAGEKSTENSGESE